jgi:hypothetical protein
MEKAGRKTLIIASSFLGVFIVVLSVLISYPHGSKSYKTIKNVSADFSSGNTIQIENQTLGTTYSYGDSSFKIDSYSDYKGVLKSLAQSDEEIEENFFDSFSLIGIERNGSYFNESIVNSIKANGSILNLVYLIEDDQIFRNDSNYKDVNTIDFIKIDNSSEINKVVLLDRLC